MKTDESATQITNMSALSFDNILDDQIPKSGEYILKQERKKSILDNINKMLNVGKKKSKTAATSAEKDRIPTYGSELSVLSKGSSNFRRKLENGEFELEDVE